MTGQMHVIILGNGMYERTGRTLSSFQPHNDPVCGLRPSSNGQARGSSGRVQRSAWTAADIRGKVRGWMARCGKDDDVVLLWSGHGYGRERPPAYHLHSPEPGPRPDVVSEYHRDAGARGLPDQAARPGASSCC